MTMDRQKASDLLGKTSRNLSALIVIGVTAWAIFTGERTVANYLTSPGPIRSALEEVADARVAAAVSEQNERTAGRIDEITTKLLTTTEAVSSLTRSLSELSATVAAVQSAAAAETERPVEIASSGHTVCGAPPAIVQTDGCAPVPIGGLAYITVYLRKFHARCGDPKRVFWFVNGGGVRHEFLDLGDQDRVGRQVPVSNTFEPAVIAQRIPYDDGVWPGRGHARVTVSYPACPHVEPWTVPLAWFRIVSGGGIRLEPPPPRE